MKRRDFSTQLAAAALGATLLGGTQRVLAANATPIEGTHYIKLSDPVPVPADGKVHVVEFFWYGCPHCNAFEPTLEPWTHHLPPYVDFQRVHVAFTSRHEFHCKIFYALQTMGIEPQLHAKVFAQFHVLRQPLDTPEQVQAFVTRNGVDGVKFMQIFNSFAVQAKVRQAKQLSEAYKIDGVPTMGVQGLYWTEVSLAGAGIPNIGVEEAQVKMLQIVDYLVEKVHAHR